jgi:hypothetical protein
VDEGQQEAQRVDVRRGDRDIGTGRNSERSHSRTRPSRVADSAPVLTIARKMRTYQNRWKPEQPGVKTESENTKTEKLKRLEQKVKLKRSE